MVQLSPVYLTLQMQLSESLQWPPTGADISRTMEFENGHNSMEYT